MRLSALSLTSAVVFVNLVAAGTASAYQSVRLALRRQPAWPASVRILKQESPAAGLSFWLDRRSDQGLRDQTE
jgi:hypothetical protein